MTMYVLASAQNVLYWFFILPIFVVFFAGIVHTAKVESYIGKYSLGITTVVQIFWLSALLAIVMYDKALTSIDDLINNPVPITIAMFTSTLVTLITICALSIFLENKQSKKGPEDN